MALLCDLITQHSDISWIGVFSPVKEGEGQHAIGQERLDLILLSAVSLTSCYKDWIYAIGLNSTEAGIKKHLFAFLSISTFNIYKKQKTKHSFLLLKGTRKLFWLF